MRTAPARRHVRLVGMGVLAGVVAVVAAAGLLALLVLPGQQSTDLPAGTTQFPETNHAHVTGVVQYDHVPPAGGPHSAEWLNCGVYDQPVPAENAVHSLEHGAVWVTYQPDLANALVAELQREAEANYVGLQRYVIVSPYPGLPAPVVVSAWGAQLRLQQTDDPRLVDFIRRFAGGGQGGELGGRCTNGVGNPIG